VTSPGQPQSGLIVEIPEADPVVGRHRARLDASALLGIPAHITVLFPFMPPGTMDDTVLAELEQVLAPVSRFPIRLDHTAWFGDDVLWLAPSDPDPFRALTQRVFQAFPAFPPFQGRFDDVVPQPQRASPAPRGRPAGDRPRVTWPGARSSPRAGR
jgi:hypothetical protein